MKNSREIAQQENQGHTILLLQFTGDENSRTFLDYDNLSKSIDGICQLYEQKLKVMNPQSSEVRYDVSELFAYLDELKDIGALVY